MAQRSAFGPLSAGRGLFGRRVLLEKQRLGYRAGRWQAWQAQGGRVAWVWAVVGLDAVGRPWLGRRARHRKGRAGVPLRRLGEGPGRGSARRRSRHSQDRLWVASRLRGARFWAKMVVRFMVASRFAGRGVGRAAAPVLQISI